MEFRILGPLEVEDDGHPIALGGEKQRSLLALLLLGRGRPVAIERLIEEIWHGEPPATAAKSIQVYATRLRNALGAARIAKRGRGYELVVAAGEVDADRFEQFVAQASGAPPAEAASQLKEALALWRGHPLADLSLEPWAETEIARLEERRLAALEDWADAELALGNHRELVPELEALVAEHPFREQLLERLVLALYRSGRQAEALSAYRRGAARLRSELGLEPSQSLRELESRILRQDESLAAPRTAAAGARRRRSWRLVVVGAGIVAAAAIAAAIVESTRGAAGSLESIPPGVAIIDVTRHRPRLVSHISTIRSPAEVTTGDGSFWVWSLHPFLMTRVDPRDGREGTQVGSPRADVGGWLIDGKTLWFSGSRLERIDIASDRPVGSKQLSQIRYDDVQGIARGAGSLWVVRAAEGDVLRLDPTTGAKRDDIPVPNPTTWLVYTPDGVWVTTRNGITRIDPATDEITASTPVPGISSNIAFGGGYTWVADGLEGTVYEIDGSTGRPVKTYEVGQGAQRLSYGNGRLWVANQDDGTVTAIDAATGLETTIRFGHPLASVAALPGRLLVELQPGRTPEDAIDTLRGKVARLIAPVWALNDPDPAVGPGPNPFIFQVEHATCAPLLGYPDAAPPAGRRLVPELAEALPSLSRDGRTYTFVVRRGFRFASGARLDARTVRFSIERALSPKLGSRAYGHLYLADLQGLPAFRTGRARHVAGITVRGNRISFTLVKPSPDFLERLSLPFFCPVPRGTPIIDGGVQGEPPPGAGPYTIKDANNGTYLILVRNPYYGGGRPHRLDAIAFRMGIATDRAVRRIVGGHWDLLEDIDPQVEPGGIDARRFTIAANASRASYRAFPGAATLYLALDTRRPPFSNPAFRREVAAAIDRRALAASVGAEPTSHLLPPGVRGGDPPAVTAAPSRTRPVRTSVQFGFQAGDDGQRLIADKVRDELAPLGIDVRLHRLPDLGRAVRDPSKRIDMAALETEILFPDPGSFLVQMLGTDVPAAWLPLSTRRSAARLRALTGKARDDDAQALASRLATHDLPVIAFGAPAVGTVLGPRLSCRTWNGVDQGFDLAGLCLTSS